MAFQENDVGPVVDSRETGVERLLLDDDDGNLGSGVTSRQTDVERLLLDDEDEEDDLLAEIWSNPKRRRDSRHG